MRSPFAARDLQAALARSEERLQALAAGSSNVTLVVDAVGTIMYVGPSVERVFGYRREDLLGALAADLVHRDDLADVRSIGSAMLRAAELGEPARCRVRHRDGTWRWVDALLTDLLDNPAVSGLVVNVRDVTAQHLADEALRRSESWYRSIVETAEEGIWIHDTDGHTTFANPKMASLLATTVAELERRTLFEFVDPDCRGFASSKLARGRMTICDQYELSLRRDDGSTIDVLVSASPLRDGDGKVISLLKMMTDISDRKHAEVEKARLMLEDALTGLASRELVTDRISQILVRQTRDPGLASVLFLDLDHFKQINDSLGHSIGDRLLCLAAARIRSAVRPQDTVGRYGGDEFVVVLDDLETVSDAIAIAERISGALRVPMSIDGNEVLITASIGVALTPATNAASLTRDADIAMYRAKQRGGARHELFDSSLRARAAARVDLENDLRTAIGQHQFGVHFQPVVAMDGRFVGFEALARWNHPTRGPVAPGEFIPLAESTGLIVSLGTWILDQACRDLARWRTRPGHSDLTVAVNLSGRQLTDPGLPGKVAAILAAHDLEPAALWLEITESVLMDDTVVVNTALTAIHDLGVRLAVDDFGTGYSSLLYLRRFPVDALKLDRFFVAGIDTNPQDLAIVRAVIDLAHSLDLLAVAEGVETSGQLEALRAMGCDFAQGFHWSPAVPADAVETLLAQSTVAFVATTTQTDIAATTSPRGEASELAGGPPNSCTVIVVDDCDGERSLLFNHLEAGGWFRVVGEAADGQTAVAVAKRMKPDLVLLDMVMPGMDGLETLSHILRVSPNTRVAILSGFVSNGLRRQAIHAGAITVLEKGAAYQSIVEQLRVLASPGASAASFPELKSVACGGAA